MTVTYAKPPRMRLPRVCYFCGASATTDEHVPPKSFYPSSMRADLITVPSCTGHNNAYSKDDEYVRVLSLNAFAPTSIKEIQDSAARSIIRSPGFHKRLMSEIAPPSATTHGYASHSLDMPRLRNWAEKIFRALYFLETAAVLEGKVHVEFPTLRFADGRLHEGLRKFALDISHTLISSGSTVRATHPDVFKYVLGAIGGVYVARIVVFDNIEILAIQLTDAVEQALAAKGVQSKNADHPNAIRQPVRQSESGVRRTRVTVVWHSPTAFSVNVDGTVAEVLVVKTGNRVVANVTVPIGTSLEQFAPAMLNSNILKVSKYLKSRRKPRILVRRTAPCSDRS